MIAEHEPMACPWGHCFAMMLPVRTRTDPRDASKTVTVVPIHDVVGASSWFGRCPASQLIVPEITPAGRQVLDDADRAYVRMLADRINKAHAAARDALGADVDDETLADYMRRHVRGTPPPPAEDDYFPGRPADAPEPGTGDVPAVTLPLTQIGYPAGKAEIVSTQEQHVAMIAAARSAIGEAQETLAVAVAAIEALEAAVSVLPPKVTAAHALVHAAVGSAVTLAEPAIAMRANVTAALDTVSGEGNVAGAVLLVRARLGSLAAQLSAASSNGATYAAMPK